MDRDLAQTSKYLSLILRHQPHRLGLTLDPAGWIDIDVLLEACAAHGVALDRATLDAIVAENDKQRFAVSEDGTRIRASQGHSVQIELGYPPVAPPEILVHGTVGVALPAIRGGGLQPMGRHAVHLSPDEATAQKVGSRRGRAVLLRVRAGDMHRDGFEFAQSANGVWLTDHVPPEYIEFPETPDEPAPPPLGAGSLSRAAKRKIAEETLAALEAGRYTAPSGAVVELRALIDAAVAGTRLYAPADVAAPRLAFASGEGSLGVSGSMRTGATTVYEVTNESTIDAMRRLADRPGLGCLNFASAKHPGGGFLNGAQAQEEALARASALYPCLMTRERDHYAANRANKSSLYLDLAIFSPDVPFFRDDDGAWLERPVLAAVITCAAPNAGALIANRAPGLGRIEPTLRLRAEMILAIAVTHGVRTFVLGAWGAGVFGNDPAMVATAFADPLRGAYAGAFDQVTFAILDSRPGTPVIGAFEHRFAPASSGG